MTSPAFALAPLAVLVALITGCAPSTQEADTGADAAATDLLEAPPAFEWSMPGRSQDDPTQRCEVEAPDDTGSVCADEGEACVVEDDGRSDCCNGRHTCFAEGCYYSQP